MRGTTADSDKSYEWKMKNRMGAKRAARSKTAAVASELPRSLSTRMIDNFLPYTVDWSPWCSPIKDQSSCGSCWSFSVVAVLEYLLNVIRGEMTILSEQSLIDCDNNSKACDGGWPSFAFSYIVDHGIVSNKDYQYVAYQSECIAQRFNPVLFIDEFYERERMCKYQKHV
jgi:C1A family cysteine protease